MNIIAGMMIPETNCAPKLAPKSSSFFSPNASSTSRAARTPAPARAR